MFTFCDVLHESGKQKTQSNSPECAVHGMEIIFEELNFIFSCKKNYLLSLRSSIKYCLYNSKIKFIALHYYCVIITFVFVQGFKA